MKASAEWVEYIPWVYGCIQGLITLIVSIVGVKYIRKEFKLRKSRLYQNVILHVEMPPDRDDSDLSIADETKVDEIESEAKLEESEEGNYEVYLF